MVLDAAERLNLWIAALAVALSTALVSPLFAVSVGIGAAMEVANFRVFRRATEIFFAAAAGESGDSGDPRDPGGEAGSRIGAAGFGMRFGLLALAMTGAVAAGAHPVGLVLGLSTIVPAVVVAALRHPMQPPPGGGEAPPPPDDPSWDDWNPWLARERRRDGDEADDDADDDDDWMERDDR